MTVAKRSAKANAKEAERGPKKRMAAARARASLMEVDDDGDEYDDSGDKNIDVFDFEPAAVCRPCASCRASPPA